MNDVNSWCVTSSFDSTKITLLSPPCSIMIRNCDCDPRLHPEHTAHTNPPDRKVHGVNMRPIWGRQDPGGPLVGPMNFAIWVGFQQRCSRRINVNSPCPTFNLKCYCKYVNIATWQDKRDSMVWRSACTYFTVDVTASTFWMDIRHWTENWTR